HVTGGDGRTALGTRERRRDGLSAGAVYELDRGAVATRHPAITPARERHDDRIEVAPLLGQPVLEARWMRLVADALENAVSDQRPEPVGQPVARRAEVALEVLEAADAEEGVAQDEER